MTIRTVNQSTAHSAKLFLGGSLGSMGLALLLLPVAGIKPDGCGRCRACRAISTLTTLGCEYYLPVGGLLRTPMRSSYKRLGVIAGFLVILALLAINTAILRHQLAIQVGNQEWFSHSRRVVQELRTIESLLKDAETGQRGYLYTEKPDYLQPYKLAIGPIDSHLDRLTAEIGNNPSEQIQAANLRTLIHQKLAELAQTISLYQAGDAAGAKALVMSDKGFSIMESIRSVVGQMEQEETSVGELRRTTYRESIRITFACIYAASAIAALGIILLALFIMRESERRERDAAALRQSEEWFRVTLSSIGDGVIVTDQQGLVSFLNPVAERLTGTSLAQAKGEKIGDVFPIFSETTNKAAENPVDKVLELGCVVGLANHTVLRHREGHLLPIEDSAAPIRDGGGRVIGVVLVFHDASRERSLQEVLRRTEKLATAARLAATVSHEINNPLEAIGNLIFLARNNPDAPDKVTEQLELAERELARVSHITRQTLGFYRESASPTSIHLPTLIESVLTLYSNKLQIKQIQIQLALEDCPTITGLAGELQQLVSNIVSNAIDAVPVKGTLKIDASPIKLADSDLIRLNVEDDGPGIAPENLKRIFDPFFTTKKDVGTGLGLWVCKEIAERHGGSVQVRSKNGNENGARGAIFTVLLPYESQQQ
jgi:PAS domain S-box-containing protein